MEQSNKDKKDFLRESTLNLETRRPRPKRKIIPSGVKVCKTPALNDLISDALSIIGSELSHYKNKTGRGNTLDLKEARAVNSYMDTLIKLSAEARELQKPEQLDHLTDEQLLALASKATEDIEASEDSKD